MKRYVCPVCERELTAKSYCKACRKVVRDPWVYEGFLPNEDTGGYLLNHGDMHPGERCVEPNRDRKCETPQEKRQDARFASARADQTVYQRYQGSNSGGQNTRSRNTAGRGQSTAGRNQRTARSQSTAPGSQIWQNGGSGGGKARSTANRSGGKKKKSGVKVMLAAWLIVFVLGMLSELDIGSLIEDVFSSHEDSVNYEPSGYAGSNKNFYDDGTEVLVETEPVSVEAETDSEENTEYDWLDGWANGWTESTESTDSDWTESTEDGWLSGWEESTEDDWWSGWEDDTEDDWESSWEEVEYEDILAIGLPCNGYDHYAFSGKTAYELMVDTASSDMGLVMTDTSDYMYNDVYHDSYYGDTTYYSRYRYWDWADGYIGVISDSVSDEVHSIDVYGWELSEVMELGMEALALVESEAAAEAVRKNLNEVLASGEDLTYGIFIDEGNTTVWFCEDEEAGYYMIEVAPLY